MLTKDVLRLAKLADEIETTLANPLKQGKEFYRGDLRVLMKAAKEVQNRDWYNQLFAQMVKTTKRISAAVSRQTKPPPPHRSAR